MKSLLIAAALALGLASAATAEVVRHPATGTPAIMVDLPTGWTKQVDDSGNLIIASANRATAYSITIAAEPRSADIIAKEAMGLAGGQSITAAGNATLSPFTGPRFTGTLPMSGMALKLNTIVVKPDAGHFVAVTLVANPAATNDALAEASRVLSNLHVIQ